MPLYLIDSAVRHLRLLLQYLSNLGNMREKYTILGHLHTSILCLGSLFKPHQPTSEASVKNQMKQRLVLMMPKISCTNLRILGHYKYNNEDAKNFQEILPLILQYPVS